MARGNRNDYLVFLERVSAAKRKRIAKGIREAPLGNMEDFAYLCSNVIAEIFEGNIPPSIAEAAHPYVELMYTAVASVSASEDGGVGGFSSVLGRLQEAANAAKTLEAKYVIEDIPKPTEEKEPVVVEKSIAIEV